MPAPLARSPGPDAGQGLPYTGCRCRIAFREGGPGAIYALHPERCREHAGSYTLYAETSFPTTLLGIALPKRIVFDRELADQLAAVSAKIEDYEFELKLDSARLPF